MTQQPRTPTTEKLSAAQALAIHGAVHEVLRADDPRWSERLVGARFVGIMLGLDLSHRNPTMSRLLREALAVMQDEAAGVLDGRRDMDEEVELIEKAIATAFARAPDTEAPK